MVKTASAAEGEKEPLDPAVEKIRRKLVRFVAINLGLLLLALMAVLAAIVYKSGSRSPEPAASLATAPSPAEEAFVEADIVLPAGAKMLSHSLSGERISMDVELANGSRTIFIYDIATRGMVGRLAIKAE